MIGADTASDAASDPRLYFVIVTVLILGALGTALMRGTSSWGKWIDERRRAAEKRDDARVTDMEKDITYLKREVADMRAWRADVTQRWSGHMVWDAKALALVQIHAPETEAAKLGEPPNIMP